MPQSVLRDGRPQKIAAKLLQTRAEHIAATLGVFYATYCLGMAALQPVAGLLRDLTANPSAGMMVLSALVFGVFRRIEGER